MVGLGWLVGWVDWFDLVVGWVGGWLVDWLVRVGLIGCGWLVSLLVGWLVGWSVGRLVGWFVGWLAGWLVVRFIYYV